MKGFKAVHRFTCFIAALVILFAGLGAGKAAAAWSTNPAINNAISTAAGNQLHPIIISDGSGGAIITWQDYRGGATADIYAQRINASGVVQWTADGVAISTAANDQQSPTITSDGSGGAIITWMDFRSGTNWDIYAQRINASGVVQWTADGVAISTAAGNQLYPTITSDGSGGAIITWEDYRSGTNLDIYAQRINASGVVQWTADGVAISTAAGHQSSPTITSDGSGGAIITWMDYRGGATADIYAHRINASGVVQWTADGVAISTAANDQRSPTIINDGSNGAIITWYDFRSGAAYDIYAQRINASGVVQWPADGVAISTAANVQSDPTIISDGSGGAIITWYDFRSGTNLHIYAQRINASGVVQWTADGVAISTAAGHQMYPTIISDGSGGAIITWYDYRNGATADIYAQWIDANGALTTTYTVTFNSNGGSTVTSQTVNYNTVATSPTAPTKTGYTFAGWYSDSALTTAFAFTTAITADTTLYAKWTINTYALTYTAGANGSLTGTTPQTVNYGANGTVVTPVPATGYHFVNWSDGSTANPRTDTAVTGNITVTANFAINTYTVIPSAGTGGSISPSGAQTINFGSTTTFTVTPNTGYTAAVGGTCGGTLSGKTYTTNIITANCAVTATFKKKTYQVTPSAGANGSISPNTPQIINYGSITTFTVTPNTGYTAAVGGTCGGTLSGNTYKTKAVTGNCTVAATFKKQTYQVTSSAEANGTISPKGAQTVTYGSNTTFTVTSDAGYTASVGGTCGGTLSGNTYTTKAVTGNCTVTASFTAITPTLTTIGNDIYLNVPVIKYTDSTGSTTYHSLVFVYVPTTDNKIWFELTMTDVITDITPYLGIQMSQMYFAGSDLMLHLNNITINGAYLWADLKYMPTNDGKLWFVVTIAGAN